MACGTDVVVVGAGHAGCEAALAVARLGAQVTVVTLRRGGIAQMSCNPAIGGVGKGHLVREIDALGGAMGQVADATCIQARRLNLSRGPAVRATRVQSDARHYREAMAQRLFENARVVILEDEVVDIERDAHGITAVVTRLGRRLPTRAAIITAGTFLNGVCHVGATQTVGGRAGDGAASGLSAALRRLGITLGRFKTGTTPRLHADSIDFRRLEAQVGDPVRPRFAFDAVHNPLPQQMCHLTYTQPATHAILRDNLHLSPLYGGIIRGLGPRYCPSLEDKVVRFADRDRHQIFLEPEGVDTPRVYPSGLSTSLPEAVQDAFLRTIEGLHDVRVLQYGYAVEYDYAPPTQLDAALMCKCVAGLFLAGQVNGTSGYEEAAAQGLMAGLNAVRFVGGQDPAVLGRDAAYIGVLIDDLITQGVDEPYRMFTSRAEHRLTLRESNAEARLAGQAAAWGLLPAARQRAVAAREDLRRALMARLQAPLEHQLAADLGLDQGIRGVDALRRPHVAVSQVLLHVDYDAQEAEFIEEELKYAGYIAREAAAIARMRELEDVRLPKFAHYAHLPGLSNELQDKLCRVMPRSLGQASRIPGMTPAAIWLLHVAQRSGRLDAGAAGAAHA